jgi:hypothetical protein
LERGAVLVAASVIAWLPFTLTFVPFAGGDDSKVPSALRDLPLVSRLLTTVAGYNGERTSAGEFIQVFGITWAIAVIWLVVAVVGVIRAGEAPRIPGFAIAGIVIVALLAVALPAPVLILAGAPLAVSIWLVWRWWEHPVDGRTVVAGLFAVGFGLIVVTEFFYVQDVFEGRYNTLFKVYGARWRRRVVGRFGVRR